MNNKIHYPEYDNLFQWDKLYSINPNIIKWCLAIGFDCRTEWCKVYDGEWDKKGHIETDFVHSSVTDMIKNNKKFTDTVLYKCSVIQIKRGMSRWGCKTPEEFEKRGQHILEVYDKIKNEGYKTQGQLSKDGTPKLRINNQFVDEPGIVIDRNGKYLYHNGNHRLPMFKHLNIPDINVRVNIRHKEWVDFLLYFKKLSNNFWGENRIYQPIDHVDFTDYKCEWSAYRADLIKNYINYDLKTILDIGSLWGFFSSYFTKEGFQCTAVELNKDFLYIMKKLMVAQDIEYNIFDKNVFELDNFNYDVVLALNIFHHFLKKENTYHLLIKLLKNLNMQEMYFQPHRQEEAQMVGAYRNYNEDEFVEFILANSCLDKSLLIGNENGRNIYRLWR